MMLLCLNKLGYGLLVTILTIFRFRTNHTIQKSLFLNLLAAINPDTQTVCYLGQGRSYSFVAWYSVSIVPSDHEYVESFGLARGKAISDRLFADGAELRPHPFSEVVRSAEMRLHL